MSIYHDEVEIEDFEYDEEEEIYYYPCPCGDRFQITKEELMEGEEVATCPSCSLIIKVIYDPDMFKAEDQEDGILNEKLTQLKLETN
ncbi:diphthamide biosynthesis protein 3 [Musca domestica]|uniref:Diphthamide biosynthesis protein 3 n=1 Tax=Musca domestica TaxID=7370 RepID=A0A1I8MAB4_MUSDO|nr:diphthamide biosynthesis protein 3 [Musca domestica]